MTIPENLHKFSSSISAFFFNYSSVREIEVQQTFVGILHRALQLIVLSYIFLLVVTDVLLYSMIPIIFLSYIVWKRKGYQRFQEPHGSSIIKVKGIGRVMVGNPLFLPGISATTS